MRGQPAADALGVAGRAVERRLDRDPPAAVVADLPAAADVAGHCGGRDVAEDEDPERAEDQLVDAAAAGQPEVGGGEVVGAERPGQGRGDGRRPERGRGVDRVRRCARRRRAGTRPAR